MDDMEDYFYDDRHDTHDEAEEMEFKTLRKKACPECRCYASHHANCPEHEPEEEEVPNE